MTDEALVARSKAGNWINCPSCEARWRGNVFPYFFPLENVRNETSLTDIGKSPQHIVCIGLLGTLYSAQSPTAGCFFAGRTL